ncbi:MAG TPA: polyprenyl synthetase family protein [Candidatus Bathyarchaeia archaeon]
MSEITLSAMKKKIAVRMDYYLKRNFGSKTLAYDLLADYPTRPGKGIRPLFCLAAAASVGGDYNKAIDTATSIELLHNSFLIKDDIVDQSIYRRGDLTLNRKYGLALAANAGDAVKILAMSPLIDNLSSIGVRKSLQIIMEIQETARRSVEGQIKELTFVKDNRVDLTAEDYFNICENKTCWYTIITPCRTGIIIGLDDASPKELDAITRYALYIGIAFQITDDTLNLTASQGLYGKEIDGDILEGKRTLMLIHTLSSCEAKEKERVRKILGRPREVKTDADVEYVRSLMQKYEAIEYAVKIAKQFASKARDVLLNECDWMVEKRWKNFFLEQTNFLVQRKK